MAPTVSADGDKTVTEGGSVSLEATTFADPGTLDTHTAEINWGDGTPIESGDITDGSVLGTHTYADDSGEQPFTVTVTVTDDDGDSGAANFQVTVLNLNPSVSIQPDPTSVLEGGTSLITATATDVPADEPDFLYKFNCDGDDTFEIGPQPGDSAVCEFPDGPAAPNVGVEVTDGDGGSATSSVQVPVANVRPTVTATDTQVVDPGVELSIEAATFTDPGADTHTANINWGDGTTEAGIVDAAEGAVFGTHVYADDSGSPYTVTVTVTDDDGGTGDDTFEVIVGAAVDMDILLDQPVLDEGGSSFLTIEVNPNEAQVDSVTAVVNFLGGRVGVDLAGIVGDPDGDLAGFEVECTVDASSATCSVSTGIGFLPTTPFTLARVPFDALLIGPGSVEFGTGTDALIDGDSILGTLSAPVDLLVQGLVEVHLVVDMQAIPLSGDDVDFVVTLNGAPAAVLSIEAVGVRHTVVLSGVQTGVYDVSIRATRDASTELADTLTNVMRGVNINRHPDELGTLDMGVMREGDVAAHPEPAIEPKPIINALDASLMIAGINSGLNPPGLDINRDGSVDAVDLQMLADNYLLFSDIVVETPQD